MAACNCVPFFDGEGGQEHDERRVITPHHEVGDQQVAALVVAEELINQRRALPLDSE